MSRTPLGDRPAAGWASHADTRDATAGTGSGEKAGAPGRPGGVGLAVALVTCPRPGDRGPPGGGTLLGGVLHSGFGHFGRRGRPAGPSLAAVERAGRPELAHRRTPRPRPQGGGPRFRLPRLQDPP